MHTRRFGAFIVGMWLMGTILMWFVVSQSTDNVERLFSNPPPQAQKEINDMGPDVARQIFRYQSATFTRKVVETWEIMQLGLLGALLATSILTAHRSRVVMIATVVMMACVLYQAFYASPLMEGLARSFDFLPPTAALREREAFASFSTWHRLMEILKTILALTIVGRLLFDFYDFGTMVLPWSKGPTRRRRRIRRHSSHSGAVTSSARQGTEAIASGPVREERVKTEPAEAADEHRGERDEYRD